MRLSGPWELYWGRFVDPAHPPEPDGVYRPQSWQDLGYPAYGHATYRLVLPSSTLPQPLPPVLGIDFSSVYSAYRLYVNGKLVEEVVRPAERATREVSRIPTRTAYVSITPGEDLEIVLHVSNHAYAIRSGMAAPARG